MTTGTAKKKMWYALWIMNNRAKTKKLTGRRYALLKEAVKKHLTGREFSTETRKKMSESRKILMNDPEQRRLQSERAKNYSSEHRAKIGAAHRGKTISPEMRAKQSAALAGEKNPRAMNWIIDFEDGRPSAEVTSLKTWCKDNGFKYTSLYMKIKRGDDGYLNGVRARQHILDP